MPRRAALLLSLLVLLPSAGRVWWKREAPPRACVPEGRGSPPRGWVGCAGDGGTARPLDGQERLALGLPLDVNQASADDLARVPGLSARLAAEVAADRSARGPFRSLEDLLRVRGIGAARLARARPFLAAPQPVAE